MLIAMAQTSENTNMDSSQNHATRVFTRLADCCLMDTMQHAKNDLVTLLTLKLRMLNQLLEEMGLPLSYITQLQATCTPVHPDVAQELLRWSGKQEQTDALLAQDFVSNEKLQKLIKSMCKSGHTNMAHALLAMDGLNGKLITVPNIDCKKYLENLKYGFSDTPGRYDREANDDVKRAHVTVVRKVYSELDKQRPNDAKLVEGVYEVMHQVLREEGGIELPDIEKRVWPAEVIKEGVNVYKMNMPKEHFKSFVEMMKLRNSSQTNGNGASTPNPNDEEEASQRKRPKTN